MCLNAFLLFFHFFFFSFLGQLIGILDILLRNNSHHSKRFVSSLASSRLESSKTFFDF